MPAIIRRLLNRLRYRRFDDEVQEELAFHRAMKAEELGDAAHRDPARVRRAMGNELRAREQVRSVWIPPGLDSLRQDLRDAIRLIVRRPIFTATAIAALVVGVGAAVIAFALLNALILRPLPVERPDRLVYLAQPSFSFPIIREVRARSAFLSSSFAWDLTQYDVVWGQDPELTLVMLASGDMYSTLGVQPLIGRVLAPGDDVSGAPAAVGVLSYGAWQRRYGGDPSVIGRVVRIAGTPITIVGVTPPEFFGVAPGRLPEITVPVTLTPRLSPEDAEILSQRGQAWLHFVGRLRDEVSLARAEAEFQVVWPQVLEATADPKATADRRARFLSRRTRLMPATTGFSSVRNQFRQPLFVLSGLAALLLIAGCATVANMLLAGAWGRSRELAIRLAMGCSRWRLGRQLLIEGVVLASIAGGLAILLSQWAGGALAALLTTTLDPVTLPLTVDWRVLSFTLATVLLTAIVFSLPPVLTAVRVDPGLALKAGSRQSPAQGSRAGRALVAVQIAVSVVLLIGAALLLRSLGHVLSSDPGFDGTRLLAVRLDPTTVLASQTDPVDRASAADQLYRAVRERVMRTPAVESVSLSLYPPISDEDGLWTQSIGVDEQPPADGPDTTFFNAVSPGYFETVGSRVIAGRDFTWSDVQGSEKVVIINQTLAAQFFAGKSPLGHRISIGRDASRQNMTIVGVVADMKYQRLQEQTHPTGYLPYMQSRERIGGEPLFASIRVVAPTDQVSRDVRDAIAAAAPGLLPRVERVTDRIRESLVTERLLAMLALVLAACALFLASAGLFGLMSHLVARRTQEIGIRMALGARAATVLARVLAQAIVLWAIGVAIGSLIALSGGRWIAGVLHGIAPTDPVAYVTVACITFALALVAGWIPARRAASVDPVQALRTD